MIWTSAQYQKLASIASRLGANPADLLLAMYFESGLDPTAQNQGSGAYGLIQWTPVAYSISGIKNREQLLQAGVDRQLDFAYQYLMSIRDTRKATYKNVGDVYQAIFAPGYFPHTSDSTVWYRAPSDSYELNKAFDKGNKGYITRGDASAQVSASSGRDGYQQALAALSSVVGRPLQPTLTSGYTFTSSGVKVTLPSSSSSSSLLPFLALAGSGYLYYKYRVKSARRK